jgi:nucleoside-diphosphate-sugar epimerase
MSEITPGVTGDRAHTRPALPSLTGRRVVVTGGAGLIGRAAVAAIVSNGGTVTVFDRPEAEHTDARYAPGGDVTFVGGDITDVSAVRSTLEGADAVVHLAGYAGLGMADAAETYRVNTVGTFIVLSEAGAAGLAKAVYASSINASGYPLGGSAMPPSFPYNEQAPPEIADWYSLSKQAGEDAARMVHARWGIPITGLRFPLVRDITEDGGATFGRHLRAAMAADPRRQAAEGWSYLDVSDAGRSIVAALLSDTPPAPGILVAAPRTYLSTSTNDALDLFTPTVPHAPIAGRDVALDLGLAERWLHFAATVFLDDVAPSELVDVAVRGDRA